jgi:hypothetical protein
MKNDVEIILDQSNISQDKMGTLKDPSLREKYTLDELVQNVIKYEKL